MNQTNDGMLNFENNVKDRISIEAISPINIALVKYWGKIDEHFIIPANSSLSITIDSKDMCSHTKIILIPA